MKNNVYPCKLQFYYIKVGFKGIKIIQVYFRVSTVFSFASLFLIPFRTYFIPFVLLMQWEYKTIHLTANAIFQELTTVLGRAAPTYGSSV